MIILAAAMTGRWMLLGLMALIVIPYAIVLLAPVWLAESTKVAQDHAAKEQSAIESRSKR